MKLLYIDCSMGAAGDMLSAALCELLPDKNLFIEKINSIGIPGVCVSLKTDSKCGISGTHVTVTYNGLEESPDGHHHDHHHHHGEGSAHSIGHLIADLTGISDNVRSDIKNIYDLLLDAEAHVHGEKPEHVHFHELGTMDALADIAGVCILMEMLSPDRVICSPINTGSGTVRCAHGILPVPAPAAAHLLKGLPIYAGEIKAELCTPTGAAILKYFADEFGSMPAFSVTNIGYGLGTKDFGVANCLRMMMGTSEEKNSECVFEISCNLDDMLPEDISYVSDILFENGALDVYYTPIYMKKNRPGVLLSCISKAEDKDALSDIILKHTSTWGVRIAEFSRKTLKRSTKTLSTPYGDIRIKSAEFDGIVKEKPEYDDIEKIAKETGIPISEIRKTVIK